MFDSIFGGGKKLKLIRKLVTQRMANKGYVDAGSMQKIKDLSKFELMCLPEGSLITIIETIIKSHKTGALLANIYSDIEDHRKSLGCDPDRFNEIINMASSNDHKKIDMSFPAYCLYRIKVECEGMISDEECFAAWVESVKEISSW